MPISSQAVWGFFSTRLMAIVCGGALILGAVSARAATPPQAASKAASQPIRIAEVSPNVAAAIASGGISFPTEVTIKGQGFLTGATVSIGSRAVDILTVSETEIHITVPGQPAGVMDVTVTNPDGSSTVLPKSFTYTTGPVIYRISPQTGNAGTPTVIDLTGANFSSDSAVTVGGQPAPIQFLFSATSLEVQVPANVALPAGDKTAVAVTVKNPDGQTFTLPNAFTWTVSRPAPSIPQPSPTSQKAASPDSCEGL